MFGSRKKSSAAASNTSTGTDEYQVPVEDTTAKGGSMLKSYTKRAIRVLQREAFQIPYGTMGHCAGMMLLTTVRGAFVWSGAVSLGILMRRLGPNSWSPPILVSMAGVGFGLQIGGLMSDLIFVFMEHETINALVSRGQIRLGVDWAIAAGPAGLDFDAGVNLGAKGAASVWTFGSTKGMFMGVEMKGAVVVQQTRQNTRFYGQKASCATILGGKLDISKLGQEKHSLIADLSKVLVGIENGAYQNQYMFGGGGQASNSQGTTSEDDEALIVHLQQDEAERVQLAGTGKDLLNAGLSGGSGAITASAKVPLLVELADTTTTTSSSSTKKLTLKFDHVVDEDDPSYKSYEIISLLKGAQVELMGGDLINGLGGSLSDYIEVRTANGRVGRISRNVV